MKKSFIFLILSIGFYAVGNIFALQGEWWSWGLFLLAACSLVYRDKLFLDEETEEIPWNQEPPMKSVFDAGFEVTYAKDTDHANQQKP